MSAVLEGLVAAFRRNQDYGQRLVQDLTEEQMVLQPRVAGELTGNHPAWVLSHLNAYLGVMQSVIQGMPIEDPRDHPFGMQSQPVSDRSLYASRDQLLAEWSQGHEQVSRLLEAAGDDVFRQPVQLDRWAEVMPLAGICLPYLMLNHENIHLGQLSAWRRVLGMPSV